MVKYINSERRDREPFIVGNWKMNNTQEEAIQLASNLVRMVKSQKVRVAVTPSFTTLSAVGNIISSSRIELGAQNMNPEVSGAHTGEISSAMLIDLGVTVVIVGHSERRHLYGEGDLLIKRKVKAAFAAGLDVILCVGETLSDRKAGEAKKVVGSQLRKALCDCNPSCFGLMTVAYEPVWAIGTGLAASVMDAQEMHVEIRQIIGELVGPEIANGIVIQYGGSVNANNALSLIKNEHIDGLLVGGASLSAPSFGKIVDAAESSIFHH